MDHTRLITEATWRSQQTQKPPALTVERMPELTNREVMRRLGSVFVVLLIALLFSACTKKVYTDPHEFLRSMIDQATQDDVAKRLGPPTSRTLADGSEVWAFDYRSDHVRGSQDNKSGGTVCRRLILVFDKGKTLRDWRREPC